MIANELRIGNFVNVPNPEQCPFRIDAFEYCSKKFIKVAQEVKINGTEVHPLTWYGGDLQPIELTEQWLFNFGFKKYEESDIPAYYKNFGSFLDDDYEYCFAIYQDIEENFYIQLIGKKIILKQVHKLQNVWFEITEEELNFKK